MVYLKIKDKNTVMPSSLSSSSAMLSSPLEVDRLIAGRRTSLGSPACHWILEGTDEEIGPEENWGDGACCWGEAGVEGKRSPPESSYENKTGCQA